MKNNFYSLVMEVFNRGVQKFGTQSGLAEAAKTSSANISRWISQAQSPRLKDFAPVMDVMGARIVLPDEQLDGFALVPKVKAKAGAGSSFETDSDVEGYYAFRHSFLDREHIHGDKCKMMQVIGDSMTPLICEGSTVLIDTSDNEPRDGKIFVVRLDEEVLVKRLQKIPGGWQLVSENQNFAPIPVSGEQGPSFEILGRVRWFGRVLD